MTQAALLWEALPNRACAGEVFVSITLSHLCVAPSQGPPLIIDETVQAFHQLDQESHHERGWAVAGWG